MQNVVYMCTRFLGLALFMKLFDSFRLVNGKFEWLYSYVYSLF